MTQAAAGRPTYDEYSRPASWSAAAIPLVLAGAALGREPKIGTARAEDAVQLPPHTATMDDCCRIGELLFGAPVDGDAAPTIGILEIIAPRDVCVTAIYTTDQAIDVVVVDGQPL